MHRLRLISAILISLILLLAATGLGQDKRDAIVVLKAARMLDVRAGRTVANPIVVIQGEKIVDAGAGITFPAGAKTIDLGPVTILPGLIDCHTHMMARMADDPDAYTLNLATKSQAFRALEGAANARATLLAGFTSVRDVESEGSGFADVALRDAIQQGLVEGPRMQVATRGIAAVGRYFPFGVSPDLHDFPTGAQMISGPEEARRAAREQIGGGANLIKVYADWDTPTLTVEELSVVVEEARKAGIKVAAHADSVEGIRNALTAGVNSIEHGSFADESSLRMIKDKGAYLVPTKAVFQDMLENSKSKEATEFASSVLQNARNILPKAEAMGVKIANGSDPASARDHGRNAREIVAIHKLGLSTPAALQAATINAAELMGWNDRVGVLEKGHYADVIAVCGDPLQNLEQLESVRFVMKGGTVVRNEVGACK